MNTFSALSEIYDSFNERADYQSYLSFIQKKFNQYCSVAPGYQPRAVDLGCGTGEMSVALALQGFDVIGVDQSCEMLSQAMDKLNDHPELALFFIRQDMRRLQMDAKANLFISCYDCLNYLNNENELALTLDRISSHLVDGGLLIFDVNTLYRFETYYGDHTFVYKKSDSVLVWENHYNKENRQCFFDIEIFQKEGGLYRRSREKHKQSYFSEAVIDAALEKAGFRINETISDRQLWGREGPELKRVYVAQKQ